MLDIKERVLKGYKFILIGAFMVGILGQFLLPSIVGLILCIYGLYIIIKNGD